MSQPIVGEFNTTPATYGSGQKIPIQTDAEGRLLTRAPEDGVSLTKSQVTMTGASGVLVAADSTRKIVIVSSTDGNAAAAIDPTGGTAALSYGIPLGGGSTAAITGKAAQSAMTQIGTTGQLLTVFTG